MEALTSFTARELIQRVLLDPDDYNISLTHLTDGCIAVRELVSGYLIAHLGEHLSQLEELVQSVPT